MILAVVISQIPMPAAQAVETNTITFSMNGGTFSGEYNGYNFKNRTPVLVLDNNKTIDTYPDDKYVSYSGYETEKGKWYTDKECVEEFNKNSKITESTTIYKKWYSKEDGFCLNPDKTVLYQYDGDEKLVQIPDTVTTIAADAFESLGNARGIVLSKNIETVYDNAFSGVNKENNIIYIYDNDSSQSKKMAQALADSYEQFVYSSYLDVNKVEEIVGIDYEVEYNAEKDATDDKAEEEVEDKDAIDNKAEDEVEIKTEEKTEDKTEDKTEEESESKTEQKIDDRLENSVVRETQIISESIREYSVTFDMNGGKYSGTYEGEEYSSVTSVKTKVVSGEGIQEAGYPDHASDAAFKYAGYSTDKNWYTDKNCLSKYNKTDSKGNAKEVKKNLTLYKKWSATTSGFTMNAKKTVLYKYNGGSGDVKIPETITIIGNDAFSSVSSVTSVTLPDSLTDVEDDAFSGFSAVSKEVTLTAKSERAIAIAKELAAKYKYLVYEGDKKDAKKDSEKTTERSDSVSVISANEAGNIEIGARIGGSAGTGTAQTSGDANTGTNATSSTGISLGTSVGASTTAIGENSVTVGGTPTAQASAQTPALPSAVPTASDAIAASGVPDAQKPPVSSDSSSTPAASGARTTTVSNATASSAPTGAQHVKDSTPKTGDSVQYRMLFVCILFSAGALLVLTGNGKRKKFSPS